MSDLIDSTLAHLETILRYIASGFVALLVLTLVYSGFELLNPSSGGEYPAWVTLLVAALTGITIYAVHTSIIVRFLWWLVVCFHIRFAHHKWLPPKKKSAKQVMWDLDTARWKRRGMSDPEVSAIQRELNRWAALLNYVYCSSYPLLIIPICVRLAQPSEVSAWWPWLSASGALLLFCALFSDNAITKRELWAVATYQKSESTTDTEPSDSGDS